MDPKDKKMQLVKLMRPDEFHELGSDPDEEQLDEIVDDICEALDIDFDE